MPGKRPPFSASCGIVAPNVVTTMRVAEAAERTAQVAGGVQRRPVRQRGKRHMCSSRPISARRSEETLCLHPTNTRFLWTDEVSCLATQNWRRLRAPAPAEEEGPPCTRCDQMDHMPSACPNFDRRRGPWAHRERDADCLLARYCTCGDCTHTTSHCDHPGCHRRCGSPRPVAALHHQQHTRASGDGRGEDCHWFTGGILCIVRGSAAPPSGLLD